MVFEGGIAVNLVPEPGTISLLGLGIGALVLAGGRRARK
ncbi:MAG: PEP-CTERM sorting domain-containing protein [Myxococcales bacterium]|nr:PEP-CTERM sorting domain-containing protein [Myxococcales bacterium]